MIFELAKRLGFGKEFWNGDVEAGYAYELAPSGIDLEQLKSHPGGISLPAEPIYKKYAQIKKDGTKRGFDTSSKKVELYSHAFDLHGYPAMPEYVEPALSPISRPEIAAEYPLVLTNAKFTTFVHSQQRALPSLRRTAPQPTADIHPDTAEFYGIKNKQWIVVESPRGGTKVKARVTTNIIPGVICCQHGWWQKCTELNLAGYDPYDDKGANPATLVGTDLSDPISGSLPHRSYLCRIRPAE
jgi:anaerobic selenocysteine-containing dehydrogenase